MAGLEKLKEQGWSYTVGYSHRFKGYLASVFKARDKPQKFKCIGGGDITLVDFCISIIAPTLEEAAIQAAHLALTDPDGKWYDRLPINPRR